VGKFHLQQFTISRGIAPFWNIFSIFNPTTWHSLFEPTWLIMFLVFTLEGLLGFWESKLDALQ